MPEVEMPNLGWIDNTEPGARDNYRHYEWLFVDLDTKQVLVRVAQAYCAQSEKQEMATAQLYFADATKPPVWYFLDLESAKATSERVTRQSIESVMQAGHEAAQRMVSELVNNSTMPN